MKPKLIIMTGNIASGKTTWIRNFMQDKSCTELAPRESYMVVSLDAIRSMFGAGENVWDKNLEPIVKSIGLNIMMALMAKNRNIIVDETNMQLGDRARWLDVTNWHNRIGYDYHTISAIMPYVNRHESLNRRMDGQKLAWGFNREKWDEIWSRKDDIYVEPKHSEGFNEIWRLQNIT